MYLIIYLSHCWANENIVKLLKYHIPVNTQKRDLLSIVVNSDSPWLGLLKFLFVCDLARFINFFWWMKLVKIKVKKSYISSFFVLFNKVTVWCTAIFKVYWGEDLHVLSSGRCIYLIEFSRNTQSGKCWHYCIASIWKQIRYSYQSH